LFGVLFALIIAGCSSKEIKPLDKPVEIYDLVNIPQKAGVFTKNLDINVSLNDFQNQYEKDYFSMWNIDKPAEEVSSVKWPFDIYKVGDSYGENLQLLKQDFFDEMYENANFENYATLNKRAVTLRQVNLRAFPTIKPLLKDPSLAGEGFPFDYLQNSSIQANKPLFISHYSKNKEWVFAFSSFASGWIKTSDIVFLEKEQTDLWQKAEQIFITKDNIPIYSSEGNFLFNSKIGMMLALISEEKDSFTALTIANYKGSKPLFCKSKILKDVAHKGVLIFNKDNLEKIVDGVFNTNYGWGGMYGQRDCSSTIRDMYAPFGIWLPRNSSQQAKVGEVISFKNLSDEEKIKLIKEKGVAFETLLYKKGHILLYVGVYNNEIIVFHNTWGIKTNKDGIEGRIVIGKTIFSSLRLGKNQKYYDKSTELLRSLDGMNILTNQKDVDVKP
jgi:hypothetical protein